MEQPSYTKVVTGANGEEQTVQELIDYVNAYVNREKEDIELE